MPPPQLITRRRRSQDFGGWYLRGDIGMTNQSVDSLTLDQRAPYPRAFSPPEWDFDSCDILRRRRRLSVQQLVPCRCHRSNIVAAPTFTDRMFSYRSPCAGRHLRQSTTISASKSEWVAMVNAYVDLGTWWCMTPFVGAGVGASRNTDQRLPRLIGVIFNRRWRSGRGLDLRRRLRSKWNFAWALHAGLAYKVTPNFTLELAYQLCQPGRWRHRCRRIPSMASTGRDSVASQFNNITSQD